MSELTQEELHGPGGLVLMLDYADSDTPAMVWVDSQPNFTSTYDCVLYTGEIDGEIELTQEQYDWLDRQQSAVADAFAEARKGMPEYE